jgi:hypothetical protein
MRTPFAQTESGAPRSRRARVPRTVLVTLLASLAFGSPAEARLSVFEGINFPGLTAGDNEFLGAPPDTTGALSDRYYVEIVNTRIAVYDRFAPQAGPLAERDASRFWGTEFATIVDPQVVWDPQSGRFYYIVLRNEDDANGIFVGWTKTADPTDLDRGWCRTEIPTGNLFDDYPKLGLSRNHLVIGANVADLSNRSFLFSRIWAIGKPLTLAEGCDTPPIEALNSRSQPLRDSSGKPAVTPVPAAPVGAPRRAYIVAAECVDDGEGGNPCPRRADAITVWHVAGPRDDPRLVRDGGIAVQPFSIPDPVPQRGTNRVLDASDTRLTQAASAPDPSRGGTRLVWTQHTVRARHGGSVVRWYAFDPKRLRVAEGGTVRKPGRWVFNGAVAPIERGDEAIVNYNVGGPRKLPQIKAQVAGKPHTEVRIAGSAAADETCDPPPKDFCTWGDYAGAVPDPLHPDVVWGANQTVDDPDHVDTFGIHWRTRIFALRP